jgi:hypothetical protein
VEPEVKPEATLFCTRAERGVSGPTGSPGTSHFALAPVLACHGARTPFRPPSACSKEGKLMRGPKVVSPINERRYAQH